MARTSTHVGAARSVFRPRQNWVLNPLQDHLFIIAAPLLSLGLALLAMQYLGAERGAVLVITAHVILTVSHHLPTFIRIYGDVELFRRFKWSFVLGPVVPLLFSAAVLGYINYHQYPVEYFLYLYIFLSLWDPWHFLRQHYGFMRIYDRHNTAPRALATNMDWAICTLWFVHIMVASAAWIPGLLEDIYRNADIPLLLMLPDGLLVALQSMTEWAAILMTVVYTGYLIWCHRQGYYVSPAKLALLLCTFGVMYLTYTPNDWILALAPAWGFKVGFATVGIVHMTQYLAIVWRYDQRIAQQGRARNGWFAWLHARRTRWGLGIGATLYVAACLAYGDVLTTSYDNRWLMSLLLAIGFTSTLMHYYFDGFIWKVRHEQNRDALDLHASNHASAEGATSWWSNTRQMTAGRMLLRQFCYFAVPMGLLTVGAISVWTADSTSHVQYLYAAQDAAKRGERTAASIAAHRADERMQAEWDVTEKMAQLKPTAANRAQFAFLIYNRSLYENLLLPAFDGRPVAASQREAHARNVARAATLLQQAAEQGGVVAHPGREGLTPDQALTTALGWRSKLQ